VLRYVDYDESEYTVEFEDLGNGNPHRVQLDNDGEGSLVAGGHTYLVVAEDRDASETPLAIDMNADGDIDGEVVTITAKGGLVVDLLGDFTDGDSFVEQDATVLAKNFDTGNNGDEVLSWKLSVGGSDEVGLDFLNVVGPLTGGDEWNEFKFTEDEQNDDHELGLSDWGIRIDEYNPDGSDDPNELRLDVPEQQVLAQTFVTLGEAVAVESTPATAQMINPIALGLAVLDSDIDALGDENLIIVGGPCANTVAAQLLGNPANCAEGFEPGKTMLKSYDMGEKVAILVAGYDGAETRAASRALADYENYNFNGEEVELIAVDGSNIEVIQLE
jgi:hypothetical protein